MDVMRRATTEQDYALKEDHIADGIRMFSGILQELRKSSQEEEDLTSPQLSENQLDKLQKKFVSDNRNVDSFLNEYITEKSHSSVIGILIKIIFKGEFENKMLTSVKNLIESKFELDMIGVSQGHMGEAISQEMMKYLPPKLIVDVDPDGEIDQVSDLFANKHKDIKAKMRSMRILIDKYNHIVKSVKKDLQSTNVDTRMKAVILMIVLETGVRPGGIGTSNLKDSEGKTLYDEELEEPIQVDTFGASALNLSSISKVLKGAVEFEFLGKSSTKNFIRVTQPQVVKIITELSQDTDVGRADLMFGQKFLFKNSNGNIVSNDSLNNYFKKLVGGEGLVLTDFRKLKATQAVFDHLKSKQKSLLEDIKSFVEDEKENLKERVAEEVSLVISEAIESAKVALSHSDSDVTIGQYINPLVVMKFLSEGSLDKDLQHAVITNPRHLKFDPQTFIHQAMNIKTSSLVRTAFSGWSKKANLLDTLEDLENSLSEKSSNILDTMMELEESLS